MKKLIIGALVGAIILFIWQTLSWTVLNLHGKSQQYTPKQDSILAYLQSQFTESGQYMMPNLPADASSEQQEALMNSANGKPWATVAYHSAMEMNMVTNIIRGILVNVVLMILFCWILSRIQSPAFGTVFLSSIFTGLIVFLNSAYTVHIWYDTFDLMANFTDALVGWGAAGLWLGWWYGRK